MGFFTQDMAAQLISAFKAGDANGFVQSLGQALGSAASSLQSQIETTNEVIAVGQGSTGAVRALDADFTISADRDALVFYTVETQVTASALGLTNSTTNVQLVVSGVAYSEAQHNMSVTLALSTAATHTHRKVLSGYVPRGATVNLTSSGTGTKSLISSVEILL